MMKKYFLFLLLFIAFQANAYADRVAGPSDLRDKPDGKIIVSLDKQADVDCIAVKDNWYIVRVEVFVKKADLIGQDRIKNKTTLYDSKNKKIGSTTDIVEIDKMAGIREEADRLSANIVAYLNKKYIKKTTNKLLVIEEYKLSEKSIQEIPRKNKCSELEDCMPDTILKKRKVWRAFAPDFRQDELDSKKLAVGMVSPAKVQNPKADPEAPRLPYIYN